MGEDWLPREQAPVPQKSSATKTIVIWVVLIVMFMTIYWLMSSNGPPDPRVKVGYSGWWIVGGIVATLVVVIAFFAWLYGGANKFNALQAQGLELIADGNYQQAAEFFAGLGKRYRAKPNFGAIAEYNRGYAMLRAGDTETAAGVLLAVERIPKLGAGGVRRMAAVQLARCFALGGDVEKASKWLEATRGRPAGMADPVHDRAILDALEGLVLCRQGKLDEAQRHYEAAWPRLKTYLPVNQMVECWLLRAYASTSGPRNAAAAESWLRMLRGTPTGSIAWITAHWPELATFAVTNGVEGVTNARAG